MEFILLFAEENQAAIISGIISGAVGALVAMGLAKVLKAAWAISKTVRILTVKAVANLYQTAQQKRRIHKAKEAILQFLAYDQEADAAAPLQIRIPIKIYEESLSDNPRAARKQQLAKIPPYVEWGTDLIKATALADLYDAGKIIRAKAHSDDARSFPTSADLFIFRTPENGRTVEEQELEIEEESACRNAQSRGWCEKPARYEWEGVTKTTGPGQSQSYLRYRKVANAPKCAGCVEKRRHRHNVCMLVVDLFQNELSENASIAGIQDIQTFAEICAELCITENIPAEVEAVTEAIKVQVDKATKQNREGSEASPQQPDQVEHRSSVSREDLLHKFDAIYPW